MNALEIGVVGCGGHMGLMIARLAAESDGVTLAGGVDRPARRRLARTSAP